MTETEQTNSAGGAPQGQGEPPKRLSRIARLLKYRLVVPIARGRHDGSYTARGTAIGLFFGLTPTVGIQMPMILVFWGILKALRSDWKFNLIVALAWTWPTNVLTAPFYYYLCLMTGRLMLGDTTDLGFADFRAHIDSVLAQDSGFLESLWVYTHEIFKTWGLPLFVGCIPWTIIGTWGGYYLTMKFLKKFREKQRIMAHNRRERLARKRAAKERARATQI
ncbi:DUF2062 domain-containing protein [Rhodospirillaceae bacterium KN72]|uniref:DUF2062 domain-containing protein n=1 Tax=Pacificispira spongiicola TaxID=2729598 RepID=A0A7Y0HES4_9PROT|nr:DUF2062 domain-containing protein [Pacificispira spongiicola]NMM43207.1 DUF2062 domain-containing protein [Pacificispira spongiicola]